MAMGCTYDCTCGRVLVIEEQDDATLIATDLYAHMSRHLKERYNIDADPADWGVIEIDDERG